jgi:hypothetical protein
LTRKTTSAICLPTGAPLARHSSADSTQPSGDGRSCRYAAPEQLDGSPGDKLDQITITLDSHQAYDIAHPAFWQQRDGRAVLPFTPITAAQVRAGDYAPRNAAERERTLQYLDQLEAQGSYTLMVWPLHCEIGSWGHGMHASVLAACRQWQESSTVPPAMSSRA